MALSADERRDRAAIPAPDRPPVMELRDLVVVRGGRTVLEIERLAVDGGETVSVVGPNGAGKSTLLLALAGLIERRSGSISFRGVSAQSIGSVAYRRRIGLVLADPLLLDTSVAANVAAGLRFRHTARQEVRERVDRWLERLGIAHLAGRPARHISSGEAQRVSLARALVLEPELLLLDEPFASVDPETRGRLVDDLESLLRETPVSCVFVTHDLDEAVRLGDRLAVIVDGRLRQVDSPRRVLQTPADEEVAAFVGVETRIEGTVASTTDGIAVVDASPVRLETVSSLSPGRRVLCCLRPEDVTLWRAEGQTARHASPQGPLEGEAVSSARNRLLGRVLRMVPDGPLVRVQVDCGVPVVASITRTSADDLGLAVGLPVYAAFKASAVHLIPLADPERAG